MEPELSKSELHHGTGCFDGIALAPMPGRQLVADVSFVRVGGGHPNATGADELMVGLEGDGELKLGAWLLLLPIEKHLDEFLHRFRGSLCPLVEAQIERVGLVRQYVRPVIFSELSQDQSRGYEFQGLCPN